MVQKECHAVKVRLNQLKTNCVAAVSEVHRILHGIDNIKNKKLQTIANDGFKFLEDEPKDSFKYVF